MVHSLQDLTHLKQQFIWADQHTKAFQEAKHLVSTAPRLRYFDMNTPVVLQVDASDYGLGAVLLQPSLSSTESSEIEWQPVAYSSSSLTPTEKGYAQIEKETLAIVHAFHNFTKQHSNALNRLRRKPWKHILYAFKQIFNAFKQPALLHFNIAFRMLESKLI